MKKRTIIVTIAILCLAVAFVTFTACDTIGSNNLGNNSEKNPTIKLRNAYDEVYSQYSEYELCFSIGSDDSYISVDTNPFDIKNYYNQNYIMVLRAFNEALGLPEYIYEEMGTTNSIQGKQTETANGITVTWSYHPTNGLEAVYKIAG